ncbi:MAG: enoyl-CoA hydratase/isomerase family protein [Actinomycetota bacterium]
MSNIVTYESEGRVGIITLNRPDARNAVNGDVAHGMEAAIDALEADDRVWVGILTANTEGQERPVFCAGAGAVEGGSAGVGSVGADASAAGAVGGLGGIFLAAGRVGRKGLGR